MDREEDYNKYAIEKLYHRQCKAASNTYKPNKVLQDDGFIDKFIKSIYFGQFNPIELKIHLINTHRERNAIKLPTDLEDIAFYAALELLKNKIKSVAAELGLQTSFDITWGTIPSGESNAFVGPVFSQDVPAEWPKKSNDMALIAVYQGTFTHILALSKAISYFIPEPEILDVFSDDEDALDKKIKYNNKGRDRFCECMLDILSGGNSKIYTPYWHPEDADKWIYGPALFLINSILFFIMSHEYAHIYLGHTSLAAYDKQLEFDADKFALKMVSKYIQNEMHDPMFPDLVIDYSMIAASFWFAFKAILAERWCMRSIELKSSKSLIPSWSKYDR